MKFTCRNCKEISEVHYLEIKRPRGINQVLFRCVNCEEDYHCYYTNAKIRRLQKEQVKAREEGLYDKASELYNETKRRMDELNEKKGG